MSEQADLPEAVAALRKALAKQLRPLNKALKALDGLAGTQGMALASLATHLPALTDLSAVGLEAERSVLVRRLEGARVTLAQQQRLALLGALSQAASAAGLELVKRTERPLVVLLAPVEVTLDLDGGQALLTYARSPLAACELEPATILRARTAALDGIREQALPSPDFFTLLSRAYTMARLARGLAAGERVDLVDLLQPLALLRVDPARWRKTELSKVSAYPRALLAYQLSRLRREGLLQSGAQRVELGTATGGSTRNKRDVLFLPSSPTEGQYYLSVRVAAVEGAP